MVASRRKPVAGLEPGRRGHCRGPFGAEKARDLADRCKVETLRVGPGLLLLDELAAEPGEHLGFKAVQVVAGNRLRCCYCNRVTIAYFEHAAANGDMVLGAAVVALWASATLVRAVCDDGAVVEGTLA